MDFDALYGHRNNPVGYAQALIDFDNRLPEIFAGLRDDDILMLTADHGNDPTTPGTDHSRERVPILIYGSKIHANKDIGTRDTYADVAASIADFLDLPWTGPGKSFKKEVLD